MSKSIGYGAYGGFGYADEPQWGLFNPAQSLFAQEPTLYGSLYATNQKNTEARYPERAAKRKSQHPGLPEPVGPRGAWQRNVDFKKVGEHNRLGELASTLASFESKMPMIFIGIVVIAFVAMIFFAFKDHAREQEMLAQLSPSERAKYLEQQRKDMIQREMIRSIGGIFSPQNKKKKRKRKKRKR